MKRTSFQLRPFAQVLRGKGTYFGGTKFNPQQHLKGLDVFKEHAREKVNIVGSCARPKTVQLGMDQTHTGVCLATDKQKQGDST